MRSRTRQEGTDGTLGPLLRISEDTLDAGEAYGRHTHRDVDVVAVVVSGELTHRWAGRGARLRAGEVGVLRAGAGLEHDEVAGAAGVVVVQTYLRAARPGEPAAYEVLLAASGWVDLGRPDARLWIGRGGAGEVPAGLAVDAPGGVVLVWQLDATRPSWAQD